MIEALNVLAPANNLTVTMVLVALVRTAALELLKPVFRKSMRLRKDIPAMPNSVKDCSTQIKAFSSTFGAFCFDKGSYAEESVNESTFGANVEVEPRTMT